VQLVYFAKVREAIGLEGEDRTPPANVNSVNEMIVWLSAMGPAYAAAFADASRLRFALDQEMVSPDALLRDATELAIFPPVTGG
jgi:sulfur-carrier protein